MSKNFSRAVIVYALFCCAGTGQAVDSPQVASWKAWAEGLSGSGYDVTQGGVKRIGITECAELVAVFGTCFANNAAAPYLVPQPPIGGTYVNPLYGEPFTETGPTGAPINMFYRLADTDALITIISLPPKAAYFGYQSYVFTRETSNYSTNEELQVVSPDPNRYEVVGSVGNNINDLIVGDRLSKVWNGGAAIFITTSNSYLSKALIADATAKGLNSKRMFVEPVGTNVLTGPTAADDDLLTLIRFAVPKNNVAGDHWRGAVSDNALVFRVSAPSETPVQRHPTSLYTNKSVAQDESPYRQSLAELSLILRQWLEEHEGGPALVEPMTTSDRVDETGQPHGLAGADCISKGTDCLADNQDTDAYRIAIIGKLSANHLAFITGANHTRLNNANYVSLAIYNMDNFTGVASSSQTNPDSVGFDRGSLSDSAEGVLRSLGLYEQASLQLKSDLPYLYSAALARQCPTAIAPYCIELSDMGALPESSNVGIVQRVYIRPGTTTGANPDLLITPLAVFKALP